MSWEKEKAKMEKESAEMTASLVGRKVTAAKFLFGYPGFYSTVRLEFDDGSVLEVSANMNGCSECDPEGMGCGVNVDHVKGKS